MIKFVKLGDVCLVRRGTTITRKQTKKGNVPVIAGGRKATYFHNEHNRESGTITVSGSGASAGLVSYWSTPIFASDCSTVELKDNKHNIKLVYYYMQSMQEFIYKDMRSGAAQPHVYAKDIANLNFPIISLKEQQRIVAKLDAVFAEIDKINFINMRINKNLNEISNRFTNLKFETIVEKKMIGSLCDFLNGYAFRSKDTVDVSNVQLLRMGNLYNNKLDLERRSVFYPENFANDYDKYIINPGDIVMTLTGTVGKRDYGYAIEIPEIKLKLLLNQRILKLHNFKSNIINKKYLLFYLNSKSFLDVLFKTANGTRQANLSSDTIKKLKIPIPSMDNQIKILKKLKLLNENKKILLKNLKTKSKLLNSLKFSLIKNLIKDKAA